MAPTIPNVINAVTRHPMPQAKRVTSRKNQTIGFARLRTLFGGAFPASFAVPRRLRFRRPTLVGHKGQGVSTFDPLILLVRLNFYLTQM